MFPIFGIKWMKRKGLWFHIHTGTTGAQTQAGRADTYINIILTGGTCCTFLLPIYKYWALNGTYCVFLVVIYKPCCTLHQYHIDWWYLLYFSIAIYKYIHNVVLQINIIVSAMYDMYTRSRTLFGLFHNVRHNLATNGWV